ncbi:MAG: ferritin [Spirochaetia bacterium]|jgi:ferritin|nr:ferritin [Spirochaetia bacterium]
MISKKMADRINLQINREMYSAFLYLAMAASMKEKGYTGIGKWLTVQYHEEMFHAMKFAKYMEEQGAAVVYGQIDKPAFKDGSVKEYFEQVLKHEQFVTASIREMVELARAEKDYATENLLQWYINEQVEEEANDNEILQTIDLMGSGGHSLYMLNVQLGKRENGAALDFTAL